jgi:RNA polymerase sigma-70 factor (ECF subfamily)
MASRTLFSVVKSVVPENVVSLRKDFRSDSELTLIERAQRGEKQAFAVLFELHNKQVFCVCLKMTGNSADAEDLTQEAFLQVFRCINSFRGASAFSTWLYRIAVNIVLMKLRRQKTVRVVSLDEPLSMGDTGSPKREVGKTDPSLNGALDRIILRRAAESLPPGCRQIFDLHEVEGYKHHEIAQKLHCSIGNSKSQLHRAKAHMRSMLAAANNLNGHL